MVKDQYEQLKQEHDQPDVRHALIAANEALRPIPYPAKTPSSEKFRDDQWGDEDSINETKKEQSRKIAQDKIAESRKFLSGECSGIELEEDDHRIA